ncbi:unnamed protein product [Pedinophyceae sp. YPF-701]|nr:unnamed protein product [Pedinophyceae sp. YPF-701]
MPSFEEGAFTSPRGRKLYTLKCLPDGAPRTHLIYHHGLGDHCDRYRLMMERMASKGIAVYSYDADGHGKSEPKTPADRCYIPSWQGVVDEALAHAFHVRSSLPEGTKVAIMGSSMGGLLTVHMALRDPGAFSAAVITSAAIDVEWTLPLRIMSAVGSVVAAMLPRRRFVSAVRPEDMSDEPDVLEAYLSDELNFIGNTRNRTAKSVEDGFNMLKDMSKDVNVPLLAIHGSQDRCTSLAAAKALVQQWGVEPAKSASRFVVEEDGYHILMVGKRMPRIIDEEVAPFVLQAAAE